MGAKFVYGKDSDGPFVKIMKDAADDPLTTSDDDLSKYLFNSRTNKVGYVYDILDFKGYVSEWSFGGSPSAVDHFRPAGTNLSTCHMLVVARRMSSGTRTLAVHFFPERMFGDQGPGNWVPWWEFRVKRANTNRWPGPSVTWSQDQDGSLVVGDWEGLTSVASSQVSPRDTDILHDAGPFYHPDEMVCGYSAQPDYDLVVTIWDMPMNEAALVTPTGTPVSGQEVVRISPSLVKIARPGYDVGSATDRELVVSSERVPAKIVRAGDVVIPANSYVDISSPIPLSNLTALDYHACRNGERLFHPPQLDASSFGDTDKISFEYEFFSNYVRLYNNDSSHSLYVRYLLLTDDGSDPTTGGTKVLYKGNDGTTDFIQIKKPGSSDVAPSASDILLDSRLAYLPIVAEGYIPYTDFNESPTNTKLGETAKTVSFTNTGFKPFVKFAVVYNTDTSGFTKAKHPYSRLLYTSPSSTAHQRQAREGTPARIEDTYVKFHMARNNPTFLQAIDGSIAATYGEQPIGIRYYIFAIPNAL